MLLFQGVHEFSLNQMYEQIIFAILQIPLTFDESLRSKTYFVENFEADVQLSSV